MNYRFGMNRGSCGSGKRLGNPATAIRALWHPAFSAAVCLDYQVATGHTVPARNLRKLRRGR
ncbi:hypothetical protein CBM2617_A200005 [Cupriavidus taiwanensis]|nr:hypothetical protein CBM2617_A200005 [Cupriavidus taiwanensis]SOZ78790.1 hypothetical protein CBM2618_A180005 [Cupriavidus taiwanensis]SOZ79055.1 hypothetical protein CBM2622_A170005 [Cupriavidus taiwanensis]SOZ86280.1 hypothetical protein CBM2621_A170005 [Cupriavidus taiwanensis]SPD43904.1 protein of unknown function [Cupriavidus taiwanensis]